jgi:hypothetical protein
VTPREPPALSIHVQLEDTEPRLRVVACTEGDELRLREWLRHSGVLFRVAELALTTFERLLDEEEAS